MLRADLEKEFGDTLRFVVGHLIKNAVRVPSALLQAALAFENYTWNDLPDENKIALVREIAEHTEPSSTIHRHFESFPHHFSKDQYQRYLVALKHYKAELNI